MAYAHLTVDIPARELDTTFTYEVPAGLADVVRVGTTVLVTFGRRPAIAYVMGMSDELPPDLDPGRVRPIEQVLAPPAFDEGSAQLALWMAREYAATPADAVRPFLMPGQKVRVSKDADGLWSLTNEQPGTIDDRWVELTEEGASFVPAGNARRQLRVVEALCEGPQRMAELRATLGDVSASVRALERRGVVRVTSRRVIRGRDESALSSARAPRFARLTQGQKQALETIRDARRAGSGDVVVIDGVTGSGKTEVYLRAIEETVAEGAGAIVLVPEISLTAQTVGRFRARFGEAVAVLHSSLSVGERRDQWDLVREGVAKVVVGARSALFAPMATVGLIVIDEEHEPSYKQEGAPRYHAREVAAELARIRACALVLGSATPSLESLGRCEAKTFRGVAWTRVSMPERPGDAQLPQVKVIDMASQFRSGSRALFSAPLANALVACARRGEKAVLFLNRRGFATFLMCRACGCVPECPHCSTALTYHERTHALACHTCGRLWPYRAYPDPGTCCPNCGSRYLGAFGVGTQRVEDELKLLLERELGEAASAVEVVRMDADTTRGKGAHARLLERFDAAPCAMLVGTQMIAKGLDFPEVTLVGVINADTMLKLPDFRASERTYALLEQVAGRAGRGKSPGEVYIQSYWATHPAIEAAATHERQGFVASTLAERGEVGYPPYTRITNVVVWGGREDAVRDGADAIAAAIRVRVDDLAGWEVLGPASCVHGRVKDKVRRHVIVKSPADASPAVAVKEAVLEAHVPRGVQVTIDVDAFDLM